MDASNARSSKAHITPRLTVASADAICVENECGEALPLVPLGDVGHDYVFGHVKLHGALSDDKSFSTAAQTWIPTYSCRENDAGPASFRWVQPAA